MSIRTVFVLLIALGAALLSPKLLCAQNGKNNNKSQERQDGQRVQAARQDISEVEKRLQAELKGVKASEAELRKFHEVLKDAKTTWDAIRNETERTLSDQLRLPAAIETQRKAQAAYDEATGPIVASMQANPKYSDLFSKAIVAEKSLKELSGNTTLDAAKADQLRSAASKILSDWRYARDRYLESHPDLKDERTALTEAQAKLIDIRSLLKKQLDAHPDPKVAERNYEKAKTDVDRAEAALAASRRKFVSEQSKLASERMQLSKAIAQDKKNDNNQKNKNRNKKRK